MSNPPNAARRTALLLAGAGLLAVLFVLAARWGSPIGSTRDGTGGGAASEPRLVVLSPALAQTLRDLGLGGRIVGRHGFDAWTDQAIPACGDQGGIDYEALLRARPTHVLVEWGSRPLPERLGVLAVQHGWTVRSFRLLSLEDVLSSVDELAALLRPDAAIERALRARIDSALSRTPGSPTSGRVLLIIGGGSEAAGVLGPGSCHAGILDRLGLAPALESGSAFVSMDAEDVLRLAPDTIVVIRPRPARIASESRSGRVRREAMGEVLGRLATLELPAVRDGHVFLIDEPTGLLPCTALIGIADQLRGWLGPAGQGSPGGS
ncbi:MAG: ABC transporter substrate-binding protein [Phycisphaerae bacterium]|nr:ABC transporter substrate-binding protein [Phycisphaerae bacterium]